MKDKISNAQIAQYGLMALPLAYCGLPLYIHAPDYYATQFGFSLSAIGFVLLFIRLFDAVQDPIIGYALDRYKNKIQTITVVSIIALAAGFFFLYMPFGLQSLLWFGVMLGLSTTAYSILSIHLNAQGSLWSEDPPTKTKITSVREFFGLIGLLVATILPTILIQFYPTQDSYFIYSIVFVALICISGLLFLKWSKSVSVSVHVSEIQMHPYHSIKNMMEVKSLRQFIMIYFFSILSSSFPAVLLIFFVRDNLALESYTGGFLLTYFLCAIMSIPVWKKLSEKFDREKIWLFAMILAIISFIWAFMLGVGDAIPFLLICIFTGFAFGAELSLPPAILSSHIDNENLKSTTSLIFSIIAFIGKISLTLATSLSFFVLDLFQFQPAGENEKTGLMALSYMYAFVPCVLKVVSCILMFQWFIGKNRHGESFKNINNNGSISNA